jgi:hypothetical protein
VASWLVDVFMRGLSQGIAPTDLRGQARACLDTVRVRAACLECNNDQLYALRRQLHDDYGFDTVAVELGARESPGHSATDADLIVTTQFHRPEARRLARRLRRPVIVVTLDTTFDGEVRRMLAQGEVWWICTDPRFAAKLPHLFAGASVHPLVLDRDPLETVPRDAMVYATRAAAKRLPPGWRAGEVRTVPRVFSAETARALLTFKLRRKLDAAGALTQPSRRRNSGNR